jgi:hypothetical protein
MHQHVKQMKQSERRKGGLWGRMEPRKLKTRSGVSDKEI